MMKTLDKLARMSASPYAISKVAVPAFKDFVEDYYSQNKPVLLQNAFDKWPARNWTPDSLLEVIKDSEIQIQFDRESNPNFELDSLKHKKTMPFSEYHDKVQNGGRSNDFYMTANNAEYNQTAVEPLFVDVKNFADGYFDESEHAKRSFIWYGPEGNYTPLHHDRTNNMFLQVYGRKRFLLLPPNQTPYLYNDREVFSPIDLRKINTKKYPLAEKVTPIEILLEPGDTLFIPIGWWHQVESLDVSISITMTNFLVDNYFVTH
jgi:ribosomal protein L16 Arg81 hydroxylase